jgi:anti-sigma regulatory factor (Ser/Thr protein kinase)
MDTLKVACELSEINKVRAFLKRNLQVLNVSEEDFYIIELSLLEICINIIRYAYPEKKGVIFLKTWRESTKVYIEIRDDGIPFDPRDTQKPDIHEIVNSEKKGGLGVFLTRKLMDGLSYKRENDQNVLTLYKVIRP